MPLVDESARIAVEQHLTRYWQRYRRNSLLQGCRDTDILYCATLRKSYEPAVAVLDRDAKEALAPVNQFAENPV